MTDPIVKGGQGRDHADSYQSARLILMIVVVAAVAALGLGVADWLGLSDSVQSTIVITAVISLVVLAWGGRHLTWRHGHEAPQGDDTGGT